MRASSARIAACLAIAVLTAGCGKKNSGPITISAIGGPPAIANANLKPLDAPSAILIEATAQGLVRFEASGQIEPALAQRWIVSDDGLRYTLRLAPVNWVSGKDVTAAQVVARLRAAAGPSSRNTLKPLLGVIDEIEAMTGDVLEISLKAPRPNFLQLLAQPEMAILHNGEGSGPYRAAARADGSILLKVPKEEDAEEDEPRPPQILLRGERAAVAVARFTAGTDLVTGGTAGDLPIARAARVGSNALRFDPVAGLFGFAFTRNSGPLAQQEVRAALSMALDRDAMIAQLGVPELQARTTLVPQGIEELPQPPAPGWAGAALPDRVALARRLVAAQSGGALLKIQVAVPEGPGYRMLFALARRDWARIGVVAERVADGAPDADLRLVDAVAPVSMASWYLRSFACARSAVCSVEADDCMEQARMATTVALRRQFLGQAASLLEEKVAFVPIGAPVRWNLVSGRLTGFRTNPFGRHALGELILPSP